MNAPNTTREIAEPLPCNLEAERSVLGAILLDNDALTPAMERLTPGDFFLPKNRNIFAQMIDLHEANIGIDSVTVMDALGKDLEAAGGVSYLSTLADGLPRVTNIHHYADIVRNAALRRRLIHTAQYVQEQAFAGHDAVDIVASLRKKLGEMDRVDPSTELRCYTPAELAALVPDPIELLAYPLAFRGMFSVLDGQAKASGKTTLLLHAIRSMLSGETFLGHATKKVNVLYVTEEFRRTFILALNRAGLSAESTGLHILTRDEWSGVSWPILAEKIEQKCRDLNIGWLIADTFYAIVGLNRESEQNDAGLVDSAAAPLRSIAGNLDLAALTSRHERKSGGAIGESGRGSTALTGAADVVLRLQRLANTLPTVRELEITGRIDADILTIDLIDGRYTIRGDDVRQASQDQASAVASSIAADPKISIRNIAAQTGVGRNRVQPLAASRGWTPGVSGWQHNEPEKF